MPWVLLTELLIFKVRVVTHVGGDSLDVVNSKDHTYRTNQKHNQIPYIIYSKQE